MLKVQVERQVLKVLKDPQQEQVHKEVLDLQVPKVTKVNKDQEDQEET